MQGGADKKRQKEISLKGKAGNGSNKHIPRGCASRDKPLIGAELDWLIYNDPPEYVDLILNGAPEKHLKTVTVNKPFEN